MRGTGAGVFFCRPVHCESTSLRSFAPRELPRFLATTAALTPARRLFGIGCLNSSRPGQVSLVHVLGLSHRSVTNHRVRSPMSPCVLPTRASGDGFRRQASPSGCWLAISSGRIVFVSYGPTVHLQLLRTPPRGDALTFGYRPESICLVGFSPTWPNTLPGAHPAADPLRVFCGVPGDIALGDCGDAAHVRTPERRCSLASARSSGRIAGEARSEAEGSPVRLGSSGATRSMITRR